jgi:hypothetical protein
MKNAGWAFAGTALQIGTMAKASPGVAMPSGTGADISERDAADLLHKLITESLRVQALFLGSSGMATGLVGRVFIGPDRLVWVRQGEERSEPFLRFDPAQATGFKYGDTRAFPNIPIPGDLRLESALVFLFADESQMALFEIAE